MDATIVLLSDSSSEEAKTMLQDKDDGHPETTTGSGKFQQAVLRGDNRMHIDPDTKLPASPEVKSPNGGASGTGAQTADFNKG